MPGEQNKKSRMLLNGNELMEHVKIRMHRKKN